MLKLCLLTGEYPPEPGGVGAYTGCLAEALRARGHEADVLTIQGGALVRYGADGRAEALSRAGLDWSPRCWPPLIVALDALRPAWLHIQYQTGAYAMRPGVNLLPWRLRGLRGRPRVAVTFHDLLVPYLFPKAGPLRRWANLRLARDSDAVVATNAADAERLRRITAHASQLTPQIIPIGSNIPVAPPPGYDRGAWRAGLGVAPAELLVAYFGLLSPSKGADVLVEALARLELPWRLLLVGGAATAPQDVAHAHAVRARLAELGLDGRVVATGHVPDAEVSAHLLAADCAALPFRDGASFRRGSLLAALAHGCPVISTAPADADTAARLAPAALLAPPGDAPALATALGRLAADPALAAALATAGRALAAQFSWDAIAAQHERLYEV
ncbi:MAG TPA: glycosyltransferase family 4 protein [Chloroflexaceae bacterium]|nr:glycosyltransferase family 4 protein [Chloroflexaceae bacterium]